MTIKKTALTLPSILKALNYIDICELHSEPLFNWGRER